MENRKYRNNLWDENRMKCCDDVLDGIRQMKISFLLHKRLIIQLTFFAIFN